MIEKHFYLLNNHLPEHFLIRAESIFPVVGNYIEYLCHGESIALPDWVQNSDDFVHWIKYS